MRPNLVDDAEDVVEQPAVVVLAALLSGDAVWLARVARSEAIHDSTPRAAVEGGEVRPDRSRVKGPVLHTRDQPRGGRDFPLQVADAASAWSRDVDAQLEASDAGAESEDVVGTCSHIHDPSPPRDWRAAWRDFSSACTFSPSGGSVMNPQRPLGLVIFR